MTRWNVATLSVYSTTGTAAHVSAVLGLVPVSAHEKGDRRPSKTGELPPYRRSVWSYEPDASSIQFNDSSFAALRALVNDIRDRAEALASLRPEYDTQIRWSGDVSSQGNFVIDADLLADLGRLGCDLLGTAYYESDEEEASEPGDPAVPETS